MICIGVDVGVGGGIAMIDATGAVLSARRMPETDADLWDAIRQPGVLARAVLEKVHSSPQMGVVSAFSFGGSYRACRMALTAAGIPFDEVSPFVWQRRLGCLSGGDKAVTKARAQQLFPAVRVTNYLADALLLAEFCRRTQVLDVQRMAAIFQNQKEAL